jgi:hypothetical protein
VSSATTSSSSLILKSDVQIIYITYKTLTSSTWPSIKIPSAFFETGTSFAVTSLAPSLTFGGRLLAVVGLVDFLDSSPSPKSSCPVNRLLSSIISRRSSALAGSLGSEAAAGAGAGAGSGAYTQRTPGYQQIVYRNSQSRTLRLGFSSCLLSSLPGAGAAAGAATEGVGPPVESIERSV